MAAHDCSHKYCVVGAGPSGLAVAKTFLERSIPFDWFERESDIGGVWNINTPTGVVYETTHLVSASPFTAFEDFPMDEGEYPLYPNHAEVMRYFRDFADHFDLLRKLNLNTAINHIEFSMGLWRVNIEREHSPRTYKGVILANGHHFEPRMPEIPGEFAGEIIHSSSYKSPKQLRGKRVLVIGAGNSGCDIVIDAVHNGEGVVHSMRRGYWFVPKFLLGFPTHGCLEVVEWLPLPQMIKAWLLQLAYFLLVGPPERYGLPRPNYGIHQSHPTMTDEIPRQLEHGRIITKPSVERLTGSNVVFVDGSVETVDLIVCATGYKMSFPFLNPRLVVGPEGAPKFFMNIFHPEHENLFAVGLIQANGSIWRLADYQARLIAATILARQNKPELAKWFHSHMRSAGSDRAMRRYFVASERHNLEVNYYEYRRALKRLLKKFGPLADPSRTQQPIAVPTTSRPLPSRTAPVGVEIATVSPDTSRRRLAGSVP